MNVNIVKISGGKSAFFCAKKTIAVLCCADRVIPARRVRVRTHTQSKLSHARNTSSFFKVQHNRSIFLREEAFTALRIDR
jgi:hypothetical protein